MAVAVVGSLVFDLVTRVPRWPVAGETLLGTEFFMAPGGKGANQAVAVARQGSAVRMLGKVGRDTFGDMMLAALEEAGVDTRWIGRSSVHSGVGNVMLSEGGQVRIVVVPGANHTLQPEDVQETWDAFSAEARVLLVQHEVPLDTVRTAIMLARSHGLTVMLNPAPATQDLLSLLPLVDWLTPNESEASILTGVAVDGDTGAREAASRLVARYPHLRVVITLGKEGCLYADAEREIRVPAYEVASVDATAAGDAFNGVLAVSVAEGLVLEEALARASAAGALATTRLGAFPSIPTRAEILSLVNGQRG